MIITDRAGEVDDERGVTLETGTIDGTVIGRDTCLRRGERHAEAGEILTGEEARTAGERPGDGTGDDRLEWKDRRAAEDLHVAGNVAGEWSST